MPDWIKLRPVGDQDKPLPTIWITTGKITVPQHGLHEVVILQSAEYETVATFTRKVECSASRENGLKFGTFELSESAGGKEHAICVLPKERTCSYLSGLLRLSFEKDAGELKRSVINLGRRAGCEEPIFASVKP